MKIFGQESGELAILMTAAADTGLRVKAGAAQDTFISPSYPWQRRCASDYLRGNIWCSFMVTMHTRHFSFWAWPTKECCWKNKIFDRGPIRYRLLYYLVFQPISSEKISITRKPATGIFGVPPTRLFFSQWRITIWSAYNVLLTWMRKNPVCHTQMRNPFESSLLLHDPPPLLVLFRLQSCYLLYTKEYIYLDSFFPTFYSVFPLRPKSKNALNQSRKPQYTHAIFFQFFNFWLLTVIFAGVQKKAKQD